MCFIFLLFICNIFYTTSVEVSNCIYDSHTQVESGMKIISKISGQTFEATDEKKEYNYKLGICSNPDEKNLEKKDPYASIIQYRLSDEKQFYVIGRFNSTDVKNGSNWALLEYNNGDKYKKHCGEAERVAHIMIICNSKISKGKLTVLEENNAKNSKCYYLFELEHPNVCNLKQPTNSSQSLSGWTIFFIIFVSVVSIYLCIGIFMKRIICNYRGVEMIPNITVWKCIGSNFANCVDCLCRPEEERRNNMHSYRPAATGNLTINDLDLDENDDDNLVLP